MVEGVASCPVDELGLRVSETLPVVVVVLTAVQEQVGDAVGEDAVGLLLVGSELDGDVTGLAGDRGLDALLVAAVAELDSAGFDLVKTYNNISRDVFEAIVEEATPGGTSTTFELIIFSQSPFFVR